MPSQVSTTVELVYDLCPHSRYFALPTAEQADVMGVLLRRLVALAGGGQAGIDFLKGWASFPTPPTLVNHYLTENAAWAFAMERLAELPPQATSYALSAEDCRNCIPRPPLHLSEHMFKIMTAPDESLNVSAQSTLGPVICNVYLRISVATPLQAHHDPDGPSGAVARVGSRTRRKTLKSKGSHAKHHAK